MGNNDSDRRNGGDPRGTSGGLHLDPSLMKTFDVRVVDESDYPIELRIDGQHSTYLSPKEAFEMAFALFGIYLKTT
jgi:hypothetical protein